jgi:UDP-N-acetylmuramoyl-tripeptide--D-alanyl-D-alanine ligase
VGHWLAWPLLRWPAFVVRRTLLRRRIVVAVTGSYGKSTTVAALAAALGARAPASRWARTGLALGLLRGVRRPDPLVFEVSISRPHQMAAYARLLRPNVAVVTALGGEHRLALRTIEVTAREKGHLVAAVPRGGLVVLNGDDPRVLALAARARPGVRVLTVGAGAQADYRFEDLRLDWPRGSEFVFVGPGVRAAARVRWLSEHQVRGAVAAAAVALELGEPIAPALVRLAAVEPLPGRLNAVPLASGAWLLCDDLKSGQPTIDAALDLLERLPARRKLVVLGEVTEPEISKNVLYAMLGERIGRHVQRVLYVGSKFDPLRRGLRRGGLDPAAITRCSGAREAADALAADLGSGDVVLIKGRSDQKLGRVALALAGQTVGCTLTSCHVHLACARCPMLRTGWHGRPPIT